MELIFGDLMFTCFWMTMKLTVSGTVIVKDCSCLNISFEELPYYSSCKQNLEEVKRNHPARQYVQISF